MNVPVSVDDRQFVTGIQSEPLSARIPLYFAWIMAIVLHLGKERRIGGRAVEHPMAVAQMVREKGLGLWAQIVALFHDLIEDCQGPAKVIALLVLLLSGPIIAFAVLALTNFYGKNTRRYFRQIIWSSWLWWPIIFVKLLDRLHNLVCPYGGSRKKELAKLFETVRQFQAMCRICRRFVPERFRAKYDQLLKQVIKLAWTRLKQIESSAA